MGRGSLALIGALRRAGGPRCLFTFGSSLGLVGSIRIHDSVGKRMASRSICGSGGCGSCSAGGSKELETYFAGLREQMEHQHRVALL